MGKKRDVKFDDPRVQDLYDQIVERGRRVVVGVEGLWLLRKMLDQLVQRTGFSVEWDPSTPAKLRDHLTITAVTAARWATAGATGGLLLSFFLKRPVACVLLGGTAASIVGGLKAYVAVKQGWRLHGYLDEQGVEHVEVIVKALPGSAAA